MIKVVEQQHEEEKGRKKVTLQREISIRYFIEDHHKINYIVNAYSISWVIRLH
jgi:hypothetical protein